MISLFLVALSITGYTHNGSNDYSVLTSHHSQGGSVLYYEADNYSSDIEATGNFSITTPNGTITFELERSFSSDTNYYYYGLKFKVVNDSILTNLYLYNLDAIYGCDGSEYHTALPNVYFMGQADYYVDNESGDYSVDFANTGSNPYLYLNFDIGLLPQSFIDGSGYQNGYSDGYNAGYGTGVDEGIIIGYNGGYIDGYDNASTQNQTAVTIFSGIISVGLIPINFFLACLNFEVFGINIGSFVSALLTISIVVIITRMIISGGNGGGDK